MRRALVLLALLLLALPARAESLDAAVNALPLDGLDEFARESGAETDARSLLNRLLTENMTGQAPSLVQALRETAQNALREAFPSLLTLMAPALLWALGRQLTGGGKLGAASELVCYLAEASLLAAMFAAQMDAARAAIGRIADLIARFHPVMSALLSATGAAGLAGLMRPAGALAAGLLTNVMTRAAFSLSGAAAVLAAAGGLSGRVTFDGLFKLCKGAANWIMGGATTLFLALMTAGGLLEGAKDGAAIRAAEYAVDNLLPVIGGDVADTVGALASGAALLRGALGVTGTALLIGACLAPAARLTAAILGCRLAAALAEPAADGPLVKCLRGFADAMQILLVAMAACASLFLVIASAGVAAGGALLRR